LRLEGGGHLRRAGSGVVADLEAVAAAGADLDGLGTVVGRGDEHGRIVVAVAADADAAAAQARPNQVEVFVASDLAGRYLQRRLVGGRGQGDLLAGAIGGAGVVGDRQRNGVSPVGRVAVTWALAARASAVAEVPAVADDSAVAVAGCVGKAAGELDAGNAKDSAWRVVDRAADGHATGDEVLPGAGVVGLVGAANAVDLQVVGSGRYAGGNLGEGVAGRVGAGDDGAGGVAQGHRDIEVGAAPAIAIEGVPGRGHGQIERTLTDAQRKQVAVVGALDDSLVLGCQIERVGFGVADSDQAVGVDLQRRGVLDAVAVVVDAPVELGGEFDSYSLQAAPSRYQVSHALMSCLLDPDPDTDTDQVALGGSCTVCSGHLSRRQWPTAFLLGTARRSRPLRW
jgi:hypothetical protein